jgi:hypothetical protein
MGDDMPKRAGCTSCTFSEDFSNYWTAVMYFRHRNGSFKRVPQLSNELLEPAVGGMTIYYNAPNDKSVNVTAFKPVRHLTLSLSMPRHGAIADT